MSPKKGVMGFVGVLIVIVAVFGGFLFMGGKMAVIIKSAPGELLIIGGAAFGALILGNLNKTFKSTIKLAIQSLTQTGPQKVDYVELLGLLFRLLQRIRRGGPNAISADISEPEKSELFNKFPRVLKHHEAVVFLTEAFKTLSYGTMDPFDLEEMLDMDIRSIHEEELASQHALQTIADSLPGLGIVAAVLGIVKTMEYLAAGTEVIGKSVAGALVGTMLGVFLAYGIVGPIATKMKNLIQANEQFLKVIKVAIVYSQKGFSPQVAIEFARREIPPQERPSFEEADSIMSQNKEAA